MIAYEAQYLRPGDVIVRRPHSGTHTVEDVTLHGMDVYVAALSQHDGARRTFIWHLSDLVPVNREEAA